MFRYLQVDVLGWADVAMDTSTPAYKTRREMEAMFAKPVQAAEREAITQSQEASSGCLGVGFAVLEHLACHLPYHLAQHLLR